jgi:hypothetical protein
MVRVEVVDNRGIKGVLIDGYMPSFSYLQGMDWEKRMEESLSSLPDDRYDFRRNYYNKYLKKKEETPSDRIQSNIHDKITKSVKKRFCPYGQQCCAQFTYPARGTKPIENRISFERKKDREIILPAFSREIERGLEKGKSNYSFALAFLDLAPDNQCPIYNKCIDNWTSFINFQVKQEESYKDFQKFKKAAEHLLFRYIDFGLKVDWFGRKKPRL